MDDLTGLIAFLRARYDDDEREAERVEPNQAPRDLRAMVTREGSPPFLIIDSARVLADIAAKREILDLAAAVTDPHDDEQVWYQQAISDVLRRHAAPFASHPDYRTEWKP